MGDEDDGIDKGVGECGRRERSVVRMYTSSTRRNEPQISFIALLQAQVTMKICIYQDDETNHLETKDPERVKK